MPNGSSTNGASYWCYEVAAIERRLIDASLGCNSCVEEDHGPWQITSMGTT
jgi:hypothetical protein